MSKSVGNVVDPLIMADKYGSDALRMALITNSSPGNDQKFSDQRIEQTAHFANKLWNATRFVLSASRSRRCQRSPSPLPSLNPCPTAGY